MYEKKCDEKEGTENRKMKMIIKADNMREENGGDEGKTRLT